MEHPLNDESIESKILYLSTLAYFISNSNLLTEQELNNFSIIVDKLDCSLANDDLFYFIQNPQTQEIQDILKASISEIDECDYSTTLIDDISFIFLDNQKSFQIGKKVVHWIQESILNDLEHIEEDFTLLSTRFSKII